MTMKMAYKKHLLFLTILLLFSCASEEPTQVSSLLLLENRYYLEDSGDPFSGKAVSWYENGQQASELSFLQGMFAGQQHYWYENGDRKLTIHINDSLPDGVFYYQEDDYVFDALYEKGVLLSREIRYQLDFRTIWQTYADKTLFTLELNADIEIVAASEQAYEEVALASANILNGMLVISFAEEDALIGRLFFQDGEVIFQENYVDGELSILLYHDRSRDNTIFHCYYDGGSLQAVSDDICARLPARD
jgi:antitoxin component YwqK of YwqJK toxin-antitoxin module